MSHWAPQPRMKADEHGLFKMDESVTVVNKGLTPIQRQRRLDGTPHTVTGYQCDKPEDPVIYLGSDKISKSSLNADDHKEKTSACDPDEVIKAYLNK